MPNNNQVDNANENQRPMSDGLEVKMCLGLFGFAAITLAIGIAITQNTAAENLSSWYDNQFRTWLQSQQLIWIWLQDYELIFLVAFLIYMAVHATGIFVATYLIFEHLLAFGQLP
jgi:hypothetical protein